jgi:hypothetical protein
MQKSLYLVLACLLLFALAAPAQNKCVAVRGIAQESLLDIGNPEWKGGEQGPPWQGPVQLALGQDEVLIGWVAEYDGEPGPSHHTGQGRDTGFFYFDFGAAGTLTVRYTHAVWPTLPQFMAAYTGTFHAEGTVDATAGTGRFVNATGKLMSDGPFLAWDLTAPLPSGRFNNIMTGTLCNAAPSGP